MKDLWNLLSTVLVLLFFFPYFVSFYWHKVKITSFLDEILCFILKSFNWQFKHELLFVVGRRNGERRAKKAKKIKKQV